ncbi:alpha/beta hydrolase [Candidatus Nomurabacteria bacterium]|nr:MAG: alpha/beta hydrolase [Candidatus Nomurabacteria bacterium]
MKKITILTLLSLITSMFLFTNAQAAFVPYELETISDVYFGTVDSTDLYLDVIRPIGTAYETPAIIWVHGGGWSAGTRYQEPGSEAYTLASYGYAIVPVDYRLTPTGTLPEQIHDVRGAIRFIRAHAEEYNIDADHIAVLGSSVGGAIAYMTTLTNDDPFYFGEVGGNLDESNEVQAGINFFGSLSVESIGELKPSHRTKLADALDCADVLTLDCAEELEIIDVNLLANAGDAPLYTFHGNADLSVPYTQSVEMSADITALGGISFLKIIPGYDHEISMMNTQIPTLKRFFKKYLGV